MEEDELRNAPPVRLDGVQVCRAANAQVEVTRAEDEDDDDGPGTMVGHFSTFNEWYEINSWFEGHFVERIAPGAFKRTIKNRSDQSPIRVLLEHGFDPTVGDKPLGVPSTLEERDTGVYAEVPLFDTSYNRDLAPALRAGAYGQSFRFQVQRDEWVEDEEASGYDTTVPDKWRGLPQRTIKEVRVSEFGPTVFPANPGSDAGLRSTTDAFYERLRSRNPDAYDDALARAQALRLPSAPDRARNDAQATAEEEHRTDPPTEQAADPHAGKTPEGARVHSEAAEKHSGTTATATPNTTRSEATMDESMTVEERVARQSEIRARMSEIDSEFAGGVLPEDTQAEWNSLRNEYDEHDVAIEAQLARREQLAAIAREEEEAGATARRSTERVGRQAPTPVRKPENIYDLAELRQQARSMDEMATLTRDRAMRAVEQARFPGATDRAKAQEQVERLLASVDNEQADLARRILVTGSPTYERAFGKALSQLGTGGLTAEEQRALSLGVDGSGGYAVPFQLDPTVINISDGVVDPIRQYARVEQIVGKEWQGITSAGVTVSRSAEGTEVGDNSPTVAQPIVKAERVTGFIPFSMEIDQDWSSMRNEITSMLAEAKDEEEATSFLLGDGNAPNANGLVSTLAVGSQVAAANTGAVGVEDVYALEEALPPRFRARARFLANRSIYNTVRQLDTAGGANLWVRLGQGLPPELIGYPAHEASAMDGTIEPSGGGTSSVLLLGDLSKFLIVDRVGMSVELVPHLLGATRRPTGQRGILAVWRNNSKVLVDNAFRLLVVTSGL